MKRTLALILMVVFLSCDKQQTNRNPFLQEIRFAFDLNLNLPLYSPLTNVGSSVYIGNQQAGIKGVFVTNVGFDVFRAFEASCPNLVPSDCSTMTMNGQVATCPCNENEFSLVTGQLLNRPDDEQRYYDMLEYRVTVSGNTVIISN